MKGYITSDIATLLSSDWGEGIHSQMNACMYRDQCRAKDGEIERLRAEVDALRDDANRYRWLRGDTCQDHSQRWLQWEVRCWVWPRWTDDLRRSELDNAIDKARAADESKPKEPKS